MFDERFKTPPPAQPALPCPASAAVTRETARIQDRGPRAPGTSNPPLSIQILRLGLRQMVLARACDECLLLAQKERHIEGYRSRAGQEALAAAGMALGMRDFLFLDPSHLALQLVHDRSLVDIMGRYLSDRHPAPRGRRVPAAYHSVSSNLSTVSAGATGMPWHLALNWAALAQGHDGEGRVAAGWVDNTALAGIDVHSVLQCAAQHRAPVVLTLINHHPSSETSSSSATNNEPSSSLLQNCPEGIGVVCVDGHDFRAIHAVVPSAVEQARRGGGPTVIEVNVFPPRRAKYPDGTDLESLHALGAPESGALSDCPIQRLQAHLIALGHWSHEQHTELQTHLRCYVKSCWKETLAYGAPPLEDSAAPFELLERLADGLSPGLGTPPKWSLELRHAFAQLRTLPAPPPHG